MAGVVYYVDIDQQKNSIYNYKQHPITTAYMLISASVLGAQDKGFAVFNTDDNLPYWWDGVEFKTFPTSSGGYIDTSSLVLTSSFNNFTSSYNTGSFTGSFYGNGQGLEINKIISGSVSASISYDSGLETNTDIKATSFQTYDEVTQQWIVFSSFENGFNITYEDGTNLIFAQDGKFSIGDISNNDMLTIRNILLTDNRVYDYPDKDGVIALLSDIPSVSGFVPYIGATTDVDLGEYQIKAGQLEFDQTPTGSFGVGMVRWNDTDGTTERRLKGNNVTLQDGQEVVKRVVNKTGADLLESEYKVVRIRTVAEGGAQGQRSAIVLAQANTNINSKGILGVVTETINNNQEGFITLIGEVRQIDTTGSLQSETWVDGDLLYLSPTVAGQLTNIVPSSPNYSVPIATVDHAHATQGKISVHIGERLALNTTLSGNNDTAPSETAVKTYVDAGLSIKEDTVNKSISLGDISSNVKFPVWSAVVSYVTGLGYLLASTASSTYQAILTETNFGSFINNLTAKNTLVDADEVVSDDSADSNKAKKTSWLNVWLNYLKPKADALYAPLASVSKMVKLPADVTSTITTETVVSSFTYAVSANTTYVIRGRLALGCNGTGGINFGTKFPSGAVLNATVFGRTSSQANFISTTLSVSGSLSGGLNNINSQGGFAFVEIVLSVGSTAGNFQLIFASVIAGQTSTVIAAGSYLEYIKL